nr:FecR domain-containing protein [Bradyrhizobium sp. WSM2254]
MPGDVHGDSFTAKPFIAKAHGHVPDGAFVVPDPNLIFNGEFKRAGLDLVLSHEGHEFVVHDYFRGDKRAAIASPDGAHLTGDIVNALTGHVQYAQAAPGAAAAQVIGHVTKLSGSATAVRNGVSVILNNGDNVEKGDVVSTGADSTLGITFIDGTVFGLSSNARMVLNEMVYDPNGSNNSSLLSLVAGTITFVAGETAKHGDMKIDTPVATMGIRGTAVLTQINFVVPAGGGDPQPQASFQVLVEPNGTTGSYILFDKVTLLPIATVNQAGQMIQISGGNVSITNALMSPDVQKLITDVFTLKFTDTNTNTKLTSNFTDTITQTTQDLVFKSGSGPVVIATFTNLNPQGPEAPGNTPPSATRIPGQPLARSLDSGGNVKMAFALTERADTTGGTAPDTISGRITFVDQNLGDRPTVQVSLADAPNYVYKSAGQQDVTGSLTALQKQDIAATLIQINVAADGGNNNNGSAVWTYTIPDHVFDFLAAGETLTLTYMVRVDTNFAVNPESAFIPITITITGTNDKPVISTSVPVITFEGGTSVPGGPLSSDVPTSGTLDFTDVDLTDKHTVSVALTSATLPDGSTVPPGPLAAFQSAMSVAIAAGADSTGDGTGTINWSLADLPVYLADFIPDGEVLTLTYTVTLTDSQGATSQKTITVTITGTDAPAVVWIATDHAGAPSGGFWKDAANWETGTVPTINDDVIVITDQLHGLTPSYPVTIDSAAYAKSVTMNDFGGPPPKVIVQSSLTIAGALNMGADSILTTAATGTMSVGGKAEILGTSVLTNAGYLTLAGGGDFASGTKITNSGTIELSGGTLKSLATIHNAGGTLKADAGTTLVVDTATVDGGTVTILGTLELDGTSLIENGALNNSGTVNVKGTAEFAHESVSNTSTGTIKVLANGWLTVDQGSSVTNAGHITVDASGKLTVNGATISGAGPVIGNDGGDDEGGPVLNAGIRGTGVITGNGEIDLTGNAVLSDGILNNNAAFKISGSGNALSNESVTNAGTIEVLANGALAIDQGSTVDNSSGNVIVDANAALTLDDVTLSGGAIKGGGTIDVTGASRIDGGATLSVTAVTADAALTLDGVTVSGTDITDNSSIELDNTVKLKDGARIQGTSAASKGAITNNGTLEIAGAATLLNDVLTNTSHVIKIDDGQTLTLSGTEISGGTINNFSGAQGGTIDVTGNSRIDGNATLNKGTVTVENGITLTLDDATIAAATIGNGGTVKVDASKKLTLAGATLTGGALSVSGTLDSSGATTITDAAITNNSLIEAVGGLLTLTTITTATIANAGTLQANGAELDIDHEAVTNTGTLAAINGGTLKLISMTVTNDTGAVSVASGSTLDLVGAVIDGGTLTIAGTLESTGTSAINNADITNTGTITVTGGTLTIDPSVLHAITNHNLIEVVNGGALKLITATVANADGTISIDGASKLYLSDVSINGGSLSNSGNLYGVSGLNTISAAVTNTGAIEVQAGTLNLSGGLSGTGSLIIDNGATLELAGATAQTITFAGGIDMLLLDKVVGQSFTGTIAGQSTKAGTFTVTGAADITTSSGDALDFTASGGTLAAPADIILTPTGALTGAAKGIVVTQNGAGDISLTATGNITGLAGNGITLRDGPTGDGDITVNNLTGKATGTGAGSVGLLVENLNAGNDGNISIKQLGGAAGGAYGIDVQTKGDGDVTIDAGGNVTGSSIYGIRSRSYGSGSTTVTTEAGSVVTSGSSGIVAINRADAILASEHSSITVANYGTVNSGASLNQADNAPAGLEAGYLGAGIGSAANANVYGNVVVNNYGNVTAAGGYGIHAYNYGNGDVTVNDGAGTAVNGAEIGIRAQALNGGTGNVTVTLGANASVKSTTSYGILAYSIDKGDISVTLASGDSVISGGSGIVAVNYAAAIASGAHSTISVVAHGVIHSGSALNGDTTTPGAIIAGYKPGGNGFFSSAVTGDVTVTSDAIITADAGYGIEAFTWGVGKVTVTTGAGSSITAAGTAIGTFDHGGGDVTVTNNGSATGAVGLSAFAAGAGSITIVNNGHITGTSSVGISVNQNGVAPGDPAATGSTHITNTGSVVGATGFAAIYVQENTTGSATIDNSGTIGPAVASSVTSSTYAIFETGGAITINNTGHINGNISVASGTFNNNAGGIWTVAGSSVFGNVSSIVNAGEIDLLNGASISVNGTGISNSGDIDSWGAASITGTIVNGHLIEVHTGTLTLFGSLSGAGSVTIDANATLEIKNVVSQTVTFAGAGAELEIDTATFGGSIAGFAANEKIDLSTITWDSGTTAVYSSATGNLVVSDTHGHSISLKLIGNYSDAHFITSSDDAGGTIVEIAPVDEWTNPAGGDWNTASNWSLGVPAASYDVKLLAGAEPCTVDSTANVTIHDLTVASDVTLLTEPGTVFTVTGNLVDDGLIEAGPFSENGISTIDIKGNVSGTGAIEISNKAVVEIEGSVSGIVVYYDNGLGTLVLDHAKDFHGLISGSPAGAPLSSGNEIDMKDLAWTSSMSAQAQYNSDTNVTTVDFYNGATTVTLSFLGRDLNWHLQSDGHGGTTVYDPLADAPMTIETGAVLNLSEASAQSVTFANGTGTTGTFAIEHAADFTGVINGFAGDGTTANSDLIDLKDIGFSSLTGVTYTENADHLGGTLTLSDGTDTATIKFAGSYSIDSFQFASDGHGGTLIVDPPTGPTLVGTDGQDQFAFTNSTLPVQSTIIDFELGQDKIDLQKFANIQSFGDLGITQQGADTLVTLDDHQSIRLKNLVAGSLHASDFIVANHA